MELSRPPGKHVVAVLLASIAALFARAWLQIELTKAGYDAKLASDLAYFVVPPILLLLLLPVVVKDRSFLRARFRRRDLNARIVLIAIAVGVLIRIAWHSHLVAGTAFGVYASGSGVVGPPGIAYDCPAARRILLSVLVTSILIPFIEEVTHRGYVQSWFERFGAPVAIATSTAAFTVFHARSGWDFVAFGGTIIGICYWRSHSLWVPALVHAVVNLLPQVTLRCLQIRWIPAPPDSSARATGLIAVTISVAALAAIAVLIVGLGRRRAAAVPAPRYSQRVGDTLDDV